jgi:hypothetical protein
MIATQWLLLGRGGPVRLWTRRDRIEAARCSAPFPHRSCFGRLLEDISLLPLPQTSTRGSFVLTLERHSRIGKFNFPTSAPNKAARMANNHVLELPKFVWVLKIVQLVLSVLVLALAIVNVSVAAWDAHSLSVFTVSLMSPADRTAYISDQRIIRPCLASLFWFTISSLSMA